MIRTPPRRVPRRQPPVLPRALAPLSRDSQLAAEIKGLVTSGERDAARERYGELVAAHSSGGLSGSPTSTCATRTTPTRRCRTPSSRVFTHITSYREDLPFEVWFTRILVNACLDLRKSRSRRLRWTVPMSSNRDMRAEPTR